MQSVSRMPRLIKVAILCGAVPLLTGTLIYFAWRLTRIDGLMNAGVWTILFGLLAFVAGLGCLFNQSWNADGDLVARRHLRRQGAFALALLLSNFPAAAYYTLSAIDVVTHYTVDVENESDRRIESFVITGPGIRAELGPIAPGRRVQNVRRFAAGMNFLTCSVSDLPPRRFVLDFAIVHHLRLNRSRWCQPVSAANGRGRLFLHSGPPLVCSRKPDRSGKRL